MSSPVKSAATNVVEEKTLREIDEELRGKRVATRKEKIRVLREALIKEERLEQREQENDEANADAENAEFLRKAQNRFRRKCRKDITGKYKLTPIMDGAYRTLVLILDTWRAAGFPTSGVPLKLSDIRQKVRKLPPLPGNSTGELYSVRQISKWLDRLMRLGHVVRWTSGGGRGRKTYYVLRDYPYCHDSDGFAVTWRKVQEYETSYEVI